MFPRVERGRCGRVCDFPFSLEPRPSRLVNSTISALPVNTLGGEIVNKTFSVKSQPRSPACGSSEQLVTVQQEHHKNSEEKQQTKSRLKNRQGHKEQRITEIMYTNTCCAFHTNLYTLELIRGIGND